MLGLELVSIFAIFTSQAWNMTFSFYHSLITQPAELDEAARMFRLTKWERFWQLDVPSSMIGLVWNGMSTIRQRRLRAAAVPYVRVKTTDSPRAMYMRKSDRAA